MLLKVAASFWAMWADLPTPLKMSFRPAALTASTARAVVTNDSSSPLAVAVSAAVSSRMQARARARADLDCRAI